MNESDFNWSDQQEPHLARRKKILAEFPEIRELFGIDRLLSLKAVIAVSLQLTIPFFLPENPVYYFLILYIVGATLSHYILLAIHEITHDLAFKNKAANNWLAIFANFPMLFPFAMAFKYYHGKHHWQQGEDGIDTDIPSKLEQRLFRGYLGKIFWMFNQIIFYALRPVLIHPMKVNKWLVINWICQIAFSLGYAYFAGWEAVVYLLLSLLLCGGFHPVAGHFISEHYVIKEEQETYSYYGPLNLVTLNVGYHNEHHDFPNIPGSRLPEVRKIASKHYDNLYYHTSWIAIIWKFVTQKDLSLSSRIKRKSNS